VSEIKLISPMLDDFAMGDPISEHDGVRCCPAMKQDSEEKYIVKIISIPPTQMQMDALLLSGAYPDKESALTYFKALADDIAEEVNVLNKLSASEGFLPIDGCQIDEAEDGSGYDVYLRSAYAMTLQRQLRYGSLTHLSALNLGLDICAALASARRMGYLYINLKPGNIYLGSASEYRIGDIGFVNLNSLRYASLPERYRSEYTAPEITDAYSNLNATIDIYALGIILYQVFNDGNLPVRDETGALPTPAYADAEMAEIILKACSDNPDERWQDPAEMGQALVTYMQRNGAHDTPITPVFENETGEAVLTPNEEPEGAFIKEEQAEDTEPTENECADGENATDPVVSDNDKNEEADTVEEEAADIPEEEIYTEDNEGNLTLIEDETEKILTEEDPDSITYDEVSAEVSGILQQADDLIDHETPGPVVQPEPIDVPMPDPILPEEPEEANDESISDSDENSEVAAEPEDAAESVDTNEEAETDAETTPLPTDIEDGEQEYDIPKKKSAGKWIAGILITLLIAAILAVGFFFVKDYVLQRIDSVTITPGKAGEVFVDIVTEAEESKLEVVCTDTYGNRQTSEVKNGKASFENLMPNAVYTITVETTGFHYLIGDTSASYTTPNTTEIIQFTAVTGPEDGSAILSFTVSGPDSDSWIVTYTKDDGIKESVVFSGHIVTISGLTPEKNYSFALAPEKDLDMVGETTVEHTARTIIKAEKLVASSCVDGVLTVNWSVKEASQVSGWTVRCYNDSYDNTVSVTETLASFTVPDDRAAYTVEVTASGMSVSERVLIPENSTTVADFSVSVDDGALHIGWSNIQAAPEDGWILSYSIDGSAANQIICAENSASISTVIPDSTYYFTLQTAKEEVVLGGVQSYTVEAPEEFEGYRVTSDDMEFKMCLTPSNANWDRYDLSKSDYTTSFSAGENASFLVRLRKAYGTSKDSIETLFVIRDENGNIVSTATSTRTWSKMWYKNYCELDIPAIPQAPGNYTIQVYFNSAFAYEGAFTVTE